MDEAITSYIQELQETREYQTYESLYQQVCQNEDIQYLVSLIRDLQQDLVRRANRNEETERLYEQVEHATEKLYQIPLYMDYMEAVDQFAFLLNQQKLIIDEYILKTTQF